jgi:hypothetical protein
VSRSSSDPTFLSGQPSPNSDAPKPARAWRTESTVIDRLVTGMVSQTAPIHAARSRGAVRAVAAAVQCGRDDPAVIGYDVMPDDSMSTNASAPMIIRSTTTIWVCLVSVMLGCRCSPPPEVSLKDAVASIIDESLREHTYVLLVGRNSYAIVQARLEEAWPPDQPEVWFLASPDVWPIMADDLACLSVELQSKMYDQVTFLVLQLAHATDADVEAVKRELKQQRRSYSVWPQTMPGDDVD